MAPVGLRGGPPLTTGCGRTCGPTPDGRRGRVTAGAGGIDVHWLGRWINSTPVGKPTVGGEAVPASPPAPNLEIHCRDC